MVKSKEEDLLRLAVITLLIAGMFGILQYYPEGKTFDSLGMGAIPKVVALTILYAPFPIFSIYIIILGLNHRYEKKKFYKKTQEFLYDLGIYLTTFIVILTLFFSSIIWFLIKFPNFPMKIIISLIWAFIIISGIIIFFRIRKYFYKKVTK